MQALGCATVDGYLKVLEGPAGDSEVVHFLDAITTNFTSFFREADHFELLSAVVRQRLAAGHTRLRLWSAGCSTGEEPVTMAITVAQAAAGRPFDLRILATDLCTDALAAGRRAHYREDALRDVDPRVRRRWFVPTGERVRGCPTLAPLPELRECIVYKRLNLATPPFPMPGPLDAIFCRNVMIYLHTAVRQALLVEFERLVAADGLVLLGHAETLVGLRTRLRPVAAAAYRLAGARPDFAASRS